MKKTVKELLQENLKEAGLSENTLEQIEEAFNTAVQTKVNEVVKEDIDSALALQDAEYADKLENLVKQIDEKHTRQLNNVVHAINENHAAKLEKVMKRYETLLKEDAKTFKDELIENLSAFMENHLNEVCPDDMLEEAVRNKRAYNVLEQLRGILAVDHALCQESIKEGLLDGKSQIDNLRLQLEEANKENKKYKIQLNNIKVKTFLEEKCEDFDKIKRNYIFNVLGNKSVSFVKENFDSTVAMFERKSSKEKEQLVNEAIENSATKKVDKPFNERLNTKGPNPHTKTYLDVLSRRY